MTAERAMLEASLDRLAVDLHGLASALPRIDALDAYLDLARPLVDECDGRDRLWVNARVEEIWSACPAVDRRRAGRILQLNAAPESRRTEPGRRAPGAVARQATPPLLQVIADPFRGPGFGIERH